MTIAMLRARASSVMKGNRLILMVGYVLSLVSWTLVAQVFITIFGFDRVFSLIDLFFEGWTGFQWTYVLFPILLIILFVLGDMLHMSYRWFGLDLLKGRSLEVKGAFQGFHTPMSGRLLSLVLLRGVIVFGWTLLFIIPGIWKAYMYSQAANCLKDDPALSPMEALNRSEELMKGNGWKYALMQVIFAPWYAGPILVFAFFLWSNYAEITGGVEMGPEGEELIFGILLAILLILGLVLVLFSLYVEPHKMMTKQAFYEFISTPKDKETYDDFEKELLERQGVTRNKRQVTPKL